LFNRPPSRLRIIRRLWVDAPMATMPRLDALAALLAIDPDDPADADDLALLRELLARREARITAEAASDARRDPPPDLWVVESRQGHGGRHEGREHALEPVARLQPRLAETLSDCSRTDVPAARSRFAVEPMNSRGGRGLTYRTPHRRKAAAPCTRSDVIYDLPVGLTAPARPTLARRCA
jgi:hypothetical protein